MNQPEARNEIKMDDSSMYRERTFTDNTIGTIRQLTPVTPAGDPDSSRKTMFQGSTQVMTTAGPMPLAFEIEADDLAGAIAGFGDAAKETFDRTMEELREMQRQQASSIVVPGGGKDPMGGMGGMGGGGGIQMP